MSGQGVQGLPLKRPGWGPAFSQAQFKVVFNCHEGFWNVTAEEALQEKLLVGLQAAGDTVLVGATAAIAQAAFTAVLITEKEMATHSSVIAWRIPGTEEPGMLLSME